MAAGNLVANRNRQRLPLTDQHNKALAARHASVEQVVREHNVVLSRAEQPLDPAYVWSPLARTRTTGRRLIISLWSLLAPKRLWKWRKQGVWSLLAIKVLQVAQGGVESTRASRGGASAASQ